MAKQSVGFVERNIEKIVIGAAGAVLLFVLATRLSSPHTVEVGGEPKGPKDFYAEIERQAEAARLAMQQRRRDEYQPTQQSDIAEILEAPEPAPMPSLAVVPAPLNPPLPEVRGLKITTNIKFPLAQVLPPSTPRISQGKAAARLPLTTVIEPGQEGARMTGGTSDRLPPTEDWRWVTVCAAISRAAQRNVYLDLGHEAARLDLIVAEVVAERQELLPGGQWGEPSVVRGWQPQRVVLNKRTVELVPDGLGFAVTPDDEKYIGELRRTLERRELQEQLLHPAFQEYLVEPGSPSRYAWSIPKQLTTIDGTTIDLTADRYGIQFAPTDEEIRELKKTLKPAPTTDGERGTSSASDNVLRQARQLAEEGKKAIEGGDFLELKRIIGLLKADDIPLPQRKLAEGWELTYQRDIEAAEILAARGDRGREREDGPKLGDPAEPVWLNDTTVVPGRIYRYRLALVAVNQYAGIASRLENPQDARNLLVRGEWSEWSDAIAVEPQTHMMATRISGSGNTQRMRVEMARWRNGAYVSGRDEFEVGDVISVSRPEPMDYGAVVAGMENGMPFHRRSDLRDNAFRYSVESAGTGAVFLVNADGEAELRLTEEDSTASKDLGAQIRREDDLRTLLEAGAIGGGSSRRTIDVEFGGGIDRGGRGGSSTRDPNRTTRN